MSFSDRKFRIPRVWSNTELKKFAHLFNGRVLNASGWKDEDKEGLHYKSYFTNAKEYWISNFNSEARGFQGNLENEYFLDLTQEIDNKYLNNYDCIFNHTVLEHVFDFKKAFKNLCNMSKDIVVVIVPFLQEEHSDYGDFWRFTPQAVDKLFLENDFKTLYINYNNSRNTSIYIFAIASKHPENWSEIIEDKDNKLNLIYDCDFSIGKKVIRNSIFSTIMHKARSFIK